jgi:hypothetical protein
MDCQRDDEVGGEKIIRRCAWYTKLVGQHPQTGAETEQWSCAMATIPLLQIETSNQVRGVQAAVESQRNEDVNTGTNLVRALGDHMAIVAAHVSREGKSRGIRELLPDAPDERGQ